MVSPYPVASPLARPALASSQLNTAASPGGGFNFADITSGIRGVTRNFAAVFAKDPRVAQQAEQGLQQDQQLQQQKAAQRLAAAMDTLKSIGGAIQGKGEQAITPALQQLMDQAAQIMVHSGASPEDAQMAVNLVRQTASMPGLQGEGFSLSPGQQRFDAQGNLIAGVPSESNLLSPEEEAQKIRIAHESRTPAQPRSPTELEMLSTWLHSNDPELKAAAQAKLGLSSKTSTPSDISTLRGQYLAQSKDFQTVRQNYQVVSSAENTGAGDIARVFGYMKMLDPSSTVREGEQATAANAAGVPEAIRGQWNQLIGGGTLSETARKQIESQAANLYKTYEKQQKVVQKQFSDIAKGQGVDPAQVVIEQTMRGNAGNFDTMTPENLLAVDVRKLSPEERDAYNAALQNAIERQ